jgi:hypothetical protein
VDDVVLVRGLGLARREVEVLASARALLAGRRSARSGGGRGDDG